MSLLFGMMVAGLTVKAGEGFRRHNAFTRQACRRCDNVLGISRD
ncbi:MAG: hypothetical protein NT004_09535 [Bacteroidetes bacterium]|nr:hypothetical protein [Bacteroidota bacterium]